MENDTRTTVAPGVTRREYMIGYVLEGSKEALLCAGLARREWFLDGKKRRSNGRVLRQVRTVHDGRKITCRQPATGSCSVWVEHNWAEIHAHNDIHAQRAQIPSRAPSTQFAPSDDPLAAFRAILCAVRCVVQNKTEGQREDIARFLGEYIRHADDQFADRIESALIVRLFARHPGLDSTLSPPPRGDQPPHLWLVHDADRAGSKT